MLKLTPIFIVIIIGLLISIPTTFYYLFIENGGGMVLAGVLAGVYSVVMLLFLLLERLFVRNMNFSQRKVWIVEFFLIAILLFAYLFRQPTYFLKVNDNIQWFGILYNNQKSDRKAQYSFPNNKVLTIQRNEILFVSQQEVREKTMDIKSSGKKWKGYQSVTKSFDIDGKNVSCILYSPYDYRLSDIELLEIENMLRQKMK